MRRAYWTKFVGTLLGMRFIQALRVSSGEGHSIRLGSIKYPSSRFFPIATLERIMVATLDFADSNQLLPDQVAVFEQRAVSAPFVSLLSTVLRI